LTALDKIMCLVATFNLSEWWNRNKKTQTTARGHNTSLRAALPSTPTLPWTFAPFFQSTVTYAYVWPQKQHA